MNKKFCDLTTEEKIKICKQTLENYPPDHRQTKEIERQIKSYGKIDNEEHIGNTD